MGFLQFLKDAGLMLVAYLIGALFLLAALFSFGTGKEMIGTGYFLAGAVVGLFGIYKNRELDRKKRQPPR